MESKNRLSEIARLFFKLGCFAFGGPAAHIAMMEDEVVTKRKWMSREHFLDLMGATNLIPGPNSTEMTMHCGYERAGWKGLFVAGICFIFPAVVITGFLAWLYVAYGSLPEIAPFIKGIQPAVLAIIASAILKLGRKAVKNWELAVLGILILSVSLWGINEIIALLAGGIIGGFYFYLKRKTVGAKFVTPFFLLFVSAETISKLTTLKIFWTFLKVGSILYGSGYVLFAYLDAELVTNGYLTRPELMEAIGIGQFTPGPVLSTATFIGYQLGGFGGAIVATLGIFLPSFLFVWILNPLIPRMQKSKLLRGFLDSVNVAAVAVMLAVLFVMGKEALVDWQSILIAGICTALVFGVKKFSSVWVIVIGIMLGYILHLL
ncbi:MAG: chromate efflux transporter [Bacteroidia bacterium]|nr:chromate efflux transporter [Bacteroidia bacterium]MBT8277210.1 chromate efflux transporter [Bacteroidia bacterium]NNF30745.1 chromate efflux transporter [Flavobacteriaceae bacterium]NNK54787.1 chromate efflux transporter [Flavobacteriaceae bacterium]NNM08226.1 chromate efflux transporter [Flavobacteriaceae bacterium]